MSLTFERLPELDELVTGVEAMALDATDLGSHRPLLQLLLNTGFQDSSLVLVVGLSIYLAFRGRLSSWLLIVLILVLSPLVAVILGSYCTCFSGQSCE